MNKYAADELKVDFIDMLQSAGEMGIPGFKVFNIFGLPLLTSLSIESMLDEISSILPIGRDAKDSLIPYLAAINDISQMKRQLKPYKDPNSVLDELLDF